MNAIVGSVRNEQEQTTGSLDYALHVVGALGDAGMTAVPLKPTASMLAAGARAGGVSVEVAWKIYQAMIRDAG